MIALALGPLLREAGLPDGILQIVPGFGPEVGEVFAKHRRFALSASQVRLEQGAPYVCGVPEYQTCILRAWRQCSVHCLTGC